jgi:hypothetical protein
MKQENYKFVDLVSGVFLLILFFFNFLALLYMFEGNMVFSGLLSFFITTLYYFVVEQMRKNKESLIRQGFKHFSLLFISFFLLLSFVSFILMSHVINVEFNAKQDIQEEAQQKLQLVTDFVTLYESRSSTDLADYQSQLSLKYTQDIVIGKVNIYQTRVNNSKLFLKNELTKNNEKFNKVFQNWQRLNLMKTYTNLNQYLDKSEDIVNKKLKELPLNKSPLHIERNFNSINQLPLNDVLKLSKFYPPKYGFTFLVILVVHLGILLSFFLTKTRGPGTKFELSIQAKKLVREIN